MTPRELDRLRDDVAALRRSVANAQRSKIERIVLRLGFKFRPKKGGDPVYEKYGRPPLTIPGHRNNMAKHTVGGILDRIEEEIDYEAGELI